MRGDRPRALSHALVAGRVWCICSAYAWCIRGVTRNMCVKCHARDGTLPNLAVVPLSPSGGPLPGWVGGKCVWCVVCMVCMVVWCVWRVWCGVWWVSAA